MGGFPGNPPSDVLFKYRRLLSLIANKDEARNRPWVFSHRSDLNQAGVDEEFLRLLQGLSDLGKEKKIFLEFNFTA